jgi:GNAT superfamily N-acetyltransferase
MGYLNKMNNMRKENGVVSTVFQLLNYIRNSIFKITLESYYVFEKTLNNNIKMEKSRINLEVVRLNKYNYSAHIDGLIKFWPEFFRFNKNNAELKKDIEYYFQCDDECFLAIHNEDIVAMIWCGYQKNYMLKTVGKKIGLKEDEAIIHRVFVHDEYRGNNIHPFLSSYAKNILHMNKINKTYGYVGTSNMIAILSNMKMNDRCILLYHVQVNLFTFSINIFPKFPKTYIWENI